HHRRAGRPRTDGPGGAGDLRGPPHGHGPGRGRGAPVQRRDQGPFLREQDLPALLRRLPGPAGGGAIMTAMDAGTRPIITLDGPAASGKSSAAKAVAARLGDRKSTRLNSSHVKISYAVFCLKKKRLK